MDGQYAFVKYYEILEEEEAPADNMEEKLNCIRLKWERHGDDIKGRKRGNY